MTRSGGPAASRSACTCSRRRALIVLGVFLTSKILNWIVGPAFVVAVVTIVTPLALRIAGVRDPDAGTDEATGEAGAAG